MGARFQVLINIDVPDLQKAEAFYRTAFGLTVGRRFGSAGTELLGAAAPIYLLAQPAGSLASSTCNQYRHYDRHWTPVHLDFVVDDIDGAVQAVVSAGARLETPVSTRQWGRLAVMCDPFGNGFCLVQFLGHGYDEIAT